MKIAFGVEHFDSARGGAERYVWDFTQWLVGRGHALTVYAAGTPGTMEGVESVRLDCASGARSPQECFAASFAQALKIRSFDVVQGFNHVWPGDVLMLHGGVHPAFEQYNALSTPTQPGRMLKRLSQRLLPKYRALRRNERMQFAGETTQFVAVSQRVADDMVRYYPQVRSRIHVIHPGISGEVFGASALSGIGRDLRAEYAVSDETIVFLFAAHNFRLKGLHDLIRAFPGVRERLGSAVELWVAGRGHAGAYRRLTRRLGVEGQVRFIGSAEDMRRVYRAADVLAHPSYYDTFGGVVLEAMACGLPVAVSRNCGVADLVEDGRSGVLFDMPSPSPVLTQALCRVAEPSFRRLAAELNPTIAASHPMNAHFERMEELYRSLAGHSPDLGCRLIR